MSGGTPGGAPPEAGRPASGGETDGAAVERAVGSHRHAADARESAAAPVPVPTALPPVGRDGPVGREALAHRYGRVPRFVSVILSTYEQPRWLELVLWGYARQSHRDFEILVADDGSGPDTADVIDRMRERTGLRLRHLWHEDLGFRKCAILNHAVRAARGDYLIFSDGDCVPRHDFVATHVRLAAPDRFLSGGALRLPPGTSRRITVDDVTSGRAVRLGWLLRRGWRPGHRILRLTPRRRLAHALDIITPTRAKWNGGNASVWRQAAFDVNGYDLEMGYKGQDRAFGDRLAHLGLRGKQVRHRAVVVHLWHERPYAVPELMERNHRIRRRVLEGRETWTPEGIEQTRSPCVER